MVDGHLFDVLSSIAQSLRKKTELPFGGIQVRDDYRPRIRGRDSTYMFFSWSSQAIFSNYPRLPRAIPNRSSLSKARNGRSASSTPSPSRTYSGRKTTVRYSLSLGLGQAPDMLSQGSLTCSIR